MDCREVVQVVKDIKRRFGKEILLDKAKFLSAFDDFAPKLRKEKKILSVALDEKINYIFLDADARETENKASAIKNSVAKLTGEAWLSEKAAQMIADCFTEALEWDISSLKQNLNLCLSNGKADKPLEIQTAAIQLKDVNGELIFIRGQQLYLEENYRDAAMYFIMASVKGIVSAYNALAQCYECGHGVPEDKLKAFEWHLKAAVQGHAVSQIHIGYDYFHGKNTSKNRRKAFEWYLKAANQGYSYAQNETGYCYYNGYGVKEDKRQAAEWYKKAAEQGNAAAQFNFGWCCQHGIGAEKSINQAKYWYRKAADNGNINAKEMLFEI